MFYCTPLICQQNLRTREKALALAARSSLRDPSSEEWSSWLRKSFYNCVVFKYFDLGDLAFCPDREKEKRWKDLFGKKGLLQSFCPSFSPDEWDKSWISVEAHSFRYIYQAEGIVKRASKALPKATAKCLQDAIHYGWGTDFLLDFQRHLGICLWENGVVDEDGNALSDWYGPAAKRMILSNG